MLTCLPPLLSPRTRLLILGSFPGAASLRAQAYYAHPQNRFWWLLAELLPADPFPDPASVLRAPYDDRIAWMLERGVGLWDVYRSCEREGSLDSHIRAAVPNDLSGLCDRCPDLCAIAHNGGESFSHARRTRALGLPVYRLPSSSPANASWSPVRKRAAWAEVLQAAGLEVRPDVLAVQ